MIDEDLDPVSYLILAKARMLGETASKYYNLSEVIQAAEIYNQALDLATQTNDQQTISHYRRWCGACFYEGGKLRQALAVLAPILKERGGTSDDFYVAAIKYIEIAQEIPVSLKAIQKGHQSIEDFLQNSSFHTWKHMQLRKLSELSKLRGNYQKALNLAKESWAYYDNGMNGPSFLAEEYLYNLVHLFMLHLDFEQAERVLTDWDRRVSTVPSYNEMTKLIRESELARLQVNCPRAIIFARRANYIANQTKHYWRSACASNALTRALICVNDYFHAEVILKEFAIVRHSESLHDHYRFHILRGDYYLARARSYINIAKFDDEFGVEISSSVSENYEKDLKDESKINDERTPEETTTGIAEFADNLLAHLGVPASDDNAQTAEEMKEQQQKATIVTNQPSEKANKYLRHSRQAYNTALIVGKRIDTLLECNFREYEILQRLERMEAVKKVSEISYP